MQAGAQERGMTAPGPVTTLQQFYALMSATSVVRRSMVRAALAGSSPAAGDLRFLHGALDALNALPGSPGAATVALDEANSIAVDLAYETTELAKDILFFESGEEALLKHFSDIHEGFGGQVDEGLAILGPVRFRNFISDRDGTVNNYCGRYLSSVQSAYNAVFLTRFVRTCVRNGVILTSAPLENGGLVDISTTPPGTFIYAGSKGREYRNKDGARGALSVPLEQQTVLDGLNARLAALLADSGNTRFSLIGSGFQRKFGQTTVSRQDITGSIPENESRTFLNNVQHLVQELDPAGTCFRIEDTGLDIEILLTVAGEELDGPQKDFDKADGVLFLDRELDLELSSGPNLICGDTSSDVPMVSASLGRTVRTWAAFVTVKDELRRRVQDLCPNTFLTDQPDILITVLNELARRQAP